VYLVITRMMDASKKFNMIRATFRSRRSRNGWIGTYVADYSDKKAIGGRVTGISRYIDAIAPGWLRHAIYVGEARPIRCDSACIKISCKRHGARPSIADGGAFYRDISILVKGAVTRKWRIHRVSPHGVTFMDTRKPRAAYCFALRE